MSDSWSSHVHHVTRAIRKSRKEFSQIPLKRCPHDEAVAGRRMLDVEKACMQKEAWQAVLRAEVLVNAPLSVGGVPEKLVLEMREVAPDLMSSACVDPNPKERQPGELGDAPQLGMCCFFDAVLVGQRPFGDGVLGSRASNKREVLLHRVRRTKALLQRTSGRT